MSAALLGAASARADPLTFEARSLEADADHVELRGQVVLRYGRYRLTSNDLILQQRPGVVLLDGTAHLAPCPCPDPPLTLGVSAARIDDDGDVALTFPRLEVLGVPLLALPWILLRPPDKPGLLPPILELRGDDGLLVGGGARMPLGGGLGAAEVTAAGFFDGGVEVGARLTTPISTTRLVFDEIHGERGVIEAHGFAPLASGGARPNEISWEADAIRGDRAVTATPDLFDATRPFDDAAAEILRASPAGAVTTSVAAGVVMRGTRGEGELVAGPRASAAIGGALGAFGSFDSGAELAVLGTSTEPGVTSVATATAGAELDPRSGPFEVRVATRARGRTAGASEAPDTSREGTLAAALSAGLPFIRSFGGSAGDAPLSHFVEPIVEAGAEVGQRQGDFFAAALGPLPTSAWQLAGGVSTSFGSYAGRAVRLDLRAGAAGFADATTDPRPAFVDPGSGSAMGLARLTADAKIVSATAFVVGLAGTASEPAAGAAIARLRLGALAGLWTRFEIAALQGARAADARLLEDGLLGEPRALLMTTDGTSGAIEAHVPLGQNVALRGRVDADLSTPALLAGFGALRYAGSCRCFAVELGAGHREGRPGADGILSIDLAPR